jgi:5-methylcytosine-specific restriction enzyme A
MTTLTGFPSRVPLSARPALIKVDPEPCRDVTDCLSDAAFGSSKRGGKMKIRDLSDPVTASKSDWLPGATGTNTWIGFTPTDGSLRARNKCQSTVQRQFGNGYVIEYITETFKKPNPGFENHPRYLSEREAHKDWAGKFVAVHRLRTTSRPLMEILGEQEFELLQNMWAQGGNRNRWSVAFPVIESYRVNDGRKAKAILGEKSYAHLYAHSSATLRPLNDAARAAIFDLDIEPVSTRNAWIGIEDEFAAAERSDIEPRVRKSIDQDLSNPAIEGMSEERWARVRIRAAWMAQKLLKRRTRDNALRCDKCGFDPSSRVDVSVIRPRSLLDVHHKCPLEEGVRYTNITDFALLCPTCHRIEHMMLNAARRGRVARGAATATSLSSLGHLAA